jgi:signal transduction histidine kinase
MTAPEMFIPLLALLISATLLIFAQAGAARLRPGRFWLSLALAAAMTAAAVLLIPTGIVIAGRFGRGALAALALGMVIITFGALLLRDVVNRRPLAWLLVSGIWLLAFVVALVNAPLTRVGERGWLDGLHITLEAPGILTLVGLLAAGVVLTAVAFYAYLRSALAEVANRALLWGLLAGSALVGGALYISGTPLLMQAGLLALLLAVGGATYAQARHRAFNLRGRLIATLRLLVLLLLTAVVVALAIIVSEQLGLAREAQGTALIVVFALLVATLYIPIRQAGETLFARLGRGERSDPATAPRRYGQQITRSFELKQLAAAVSQTLSDVLDVRKSGLMLVNTPDKADESVTVRLLTSQDEKDQRGKLARSSPILRRWISERAPLSQYDIEYNPQFATVDPAERHFFQETGMSAYAPILIDDMLIGVLATGGKRDDAPYFPRDLDLLATLADQTAVALRNARLVADLRGLNDEMQVLNRGLEATRDQMEKLDAVKTDFITIASHELRTPLAQIRGYVDLVDALNNQGMVDEDKLGGMVDNIRKASERMEELIAAMLDVSQLDVKAMDLRFTQISLESVLRMSIEPLTDAARQRKLSLVARGLRGLPVIEADMQRLVQAFRNVVVNAIKFTPDGGRIDISAEIRPPETVGGHDTVVVSIADTGVGIHQEDLELIFRKFYRAYDPNLHSTGAYKFMGAGPGLGLTIAKGVIEGHGGRIWVESPGHDMETFPGSTFFIELPVKPPDDAKRVLTFGGDAVVGGISPIDTTIVHGERSGM